MKWSFLQTLMSNPPPTYSPSHLLSHLPHAGRQLGGMLRHADRSQLDKTAVLRVPGGLPRDRADSDLEIAVASCGSFVASWARVQGGFAVE